MEENYLKVELPDNGGVLFIQATSVDRERPEDGGFFEEASSEDDKTISAEALEKRLSPLKFIADSVLQGLRNEDNQPDEITVETSVSFTTSGNILLMKAGLESTFKITLKWTK